MNDLVEFLRAQLDDDERVARASLTPAASLSVHLGLHLWEARDIGGPEMPSVWEQGKYLVAKELADEHAQHIARWDPARVLAEVDAKRRILDMRDAEIADIRHEDYEISTAAATSAGVLDDVVKLLALPYADQPGYQEQWRPTT